MSGDNDTLARVHWFTGQILKPEHMVALEGSLLANATRLAVLQGLPWYGIADLVWDETALASGIVSIQSLTVVFRSGLLVRLGDNATLSPLSLNTANTTRATVYLQVTTDSPTPVAGDGTDPIDRLVYKLELVAGDCSCTGSDSILVGDFQKAVNGVWSMLEDVVPPLLQTGNNPYLPWFLKTLPNRLDAFVVHLTEMLVDPGRARTDPANIRRCLMETHRLSAFLADLEGEAHLHPYHLYVAIRDYYIALRFFQELAPRIDVPAYDHDALGPVMAPLEAYIDQTLKAAEQRAPTLQFTRNDDLFLVSGLPESVLHAHELYLAIQRPSVRDPVSMAGVKLASLKRLPTVYRLALKGVPYRPTENPSVRRLFGPEVDLYQLHRDEEWEYVVREGTLGFYATAALDQVQAALYWRGRAAPATDTASGEG